MNGNNKILGSAIGNCVHVSGLYHFLNLAESLGYETIYLGPAVSPTLLVEQIIKNKPSLVAVSYRLSPDVAEKLFSELKLLLEKNGLTRIRMVFGGTPEVSKVARQTNLFEKVFDGSESISDIKAYLLGVDHKDKNEIYSSTLLERIEQKYPYPVIRHHFGIPTVIETIEGVKKIAEAEVVDVISIAPDQNAQEFFFRQSEMDPSRNGAGGVPLRSYDDLRAIFFASRCGNYPLIRCYSGTQDLIKWAEMSVETIHNAWAAIPLCWYSVLDGRSKRSVRSAIEENQTVMKWYAQRGIPVEVNESHQWSLRDAHDSLAVAMAFLAAYNAKKMGVKDYVAQLMFNTPVGTSISMDVAKMLAKMELINSLADENFRIYTEVRAGIAHLSSTPFIAMGQLASSIAISMYFRPHILHVVGFSEADHAILPEELIQSCQIAEGVLKNCLNGLPDFACDTKVMLRRENLLKEARVILESIKILGKKISADPWSDPLVLSLAIKYGILDTPHFRGNPHLCGKITTQCIDGAWYAIDESSRAILSEAQRIEKIFSSISPMNSDKGDDYEFVQQLFQK